MNMNYSNSVEAELASIRFDYLPEDDWSPSEDDLMAAEFVLAGMIRNGEVIDPWKVLAFNDEPPF